MPCPCPSAWHSPSRQWPCTALPAPSPALWGAATCQLLPAKLWGLWPHGTKPIGGNVPTAACCPACKSHAHESAGIHQLSSALAWYTGKTHFPDETLCLLVQFQSAGACSLMQLHMFKATVAAHKTLQLSICKHTPVLLQGIRLVCTLPH